MSKKKIFEKDSNFSIKTIFSGKKREISLNKS